MRRILIIVATVALTISALRAEDVRSSNSPASSERGSNFPTTQRGPAFPATRSNQQPNPSFGARAPTPQIPMPSATPGKPSRRGSNSSAGTNEINLSNQNLTATGAGRWHRMLLGGGGMVTYGQAVADGTQVVRTDSSGAYIRQGANQTWKQLVTYPSLSGMFGGNFAQGSQGAVCEIAIAPSNSNHLYLLMQLNAASAPLPTGSRVYSTTNKAASWTMTNSSFNGTCTGGETPMRQFGAYMRVDPEDENTVYVGDIIKGVFYTTNAGGSWTHISTVPNATIFPGTSLGGGSLIEFAPSGHTVYVSSYGTGVYKCTTANTTPSCTLLNTTGMPTIPYMMKTDSAGTLWVKDTNNIIYQHKTSWVQPTGLAGVGVCCLVVMPSNPNVAYAINWLGPGDPGGGGLYYSSNAQSSPPSFSLLPQGTMHASVIGWMGTPPWSSFLAGISAFADPSQPNQIYITTGVGVAGLNPPTSNVPYQYDWDQTTGIENMFFDGIWPINAGNIFLIGQDILAWFPAPVASGQYPSAVYGNGGHVLTDQFNSGCTDGGSVYIGLSGWDPAGGRQTGITYTLNGPGGTWAPFNSHYPTAQYYGQCYVRSSSDWIILQGGNVYRSTDHFATFTPCTFSNAMAGGTVTYNGGGWTQLSADAGGNIFLWNDGSGRSNGRNANGLWKGATTGCSFTQINNTYFKGYSFGFNLVPGRTCNTTDAVMWGSYPIYIHSSNYFDMNYWLGYSNDCGVTWQDFTHNLKNILSMNWGAPLSGSNGFPTMYCICMYASDGVHYTFGIWQVENINSGAPIFNNIDAADNGYPLGIFGVPFLAGDTATPDLVYVCFIGMSCVYRD